MTRVTSLKELKELAAGQTVSCFILLDGGLRSSKLVDFDPETQTWTVFNEIDDSEMDSMTSEELAEFTHIPEAIEQGALILHGS